MAHHKSSKKRIRQADVRRVENRYHARTMRNSLKELRQTDEKQAAEELAPKVMSMLDKLAKKNIIHKNKADNLKSSIARHVSSLS